MIVMVDPLAEVAVRVQADFADHATLSEILAVIDRCRADLDTPSAAALPELVERLARQRLTDRFGLETEHPKRVSASSARIESHRPDPG